MIGFVAFKLLEKAVLKYSGVELPEEAIYAVDSAFLGVQWLMGHGPKSVKSLLLTAGVYGLPAICRLFDQDQAAHYIEILPKVYSTVWMVYTAIFTIAMVLLAFGAYKALPSLLNSLQSGSSQSSESGSRQQTTKADKSSRSSPRPTVESGEDSDTSSTRDGEGQTSSAKPRRKRAAKE